MSLALLADAPCADCGALLAEGQRYCVHCGGRRPDVEDPALAWLARSKRDQTVPVATAPAGPPARNPLALPALSLLILPIAVAIGVLAGHHGGGSDQQLIEALRNEKPPVVHVNGGAGGAAVAAARAHVKKAKAGKAKADKTGGKVVAQTKYGVAHQVTGYKPTAAKVQSDKKLVQHINSSIGKNYLQAQRNLPDTVVVTRGSGGSSQGAQGRGD
jgi:hypothetical protein